MLDHLGFPVSDYARAKAFYETALKPLGYGLIMEATPEQTGEGYACGFGPEGRAQFWIAEGGAPDKHLHIAFAAKSRAEVRAFYEAALAAGARDNGPPGVREIYHPTYYGAFVLDPDGHNIEAVCHAPD